MLLLVTIINFKIVSPVIALAPGNLSLNGGSDQNFMRLACAAAEKDLTEFFIRWGLVPDGDTTSYAGQFPKEERALYYLTDNASHAARGNYYKL